MNKIFRDISIAIMTIGMITSMIVACLILTCYS